MKPAVALLIPVYKDQRGLDLSLSSLPWEIPLHVIVVDDGSQPPIQIPNLPEPHKGILLRTERNEGIEHALNYGLKWILQQQYEYVARLDAGDICLPGRFAAQLDFLEKNPDYALVGGQVRFVDNDGRELFRERFPEKHEDIRRAMHARNCFIHPAVMIRVSALREVGLYSSDHKAVEDYELFFRITKRFKVANLSQVVLTCRINPKGISIRKRRTQIIGRLRVMLKNFEPLRKESWLGLMKNLLLLVTPLQTVRFLKQKLERYRGWL